MMPLLALIGCGPNVVKGTIGGETIEVASVLFAEHPEAYGDGGDGLILSVLTDLPDACATYQYYFSEQANLDTPEAQADLWAATFPPEFWEVLVVLRVPDTNVTYAHQTFEGLAWYEYLDDPNRFFAKLSRHVAHRDASWFADEQVDTEAYVEEYLSHQGGMHLKHHEPGVRLHAQVDTLVVETDAVEVQGVFQLRFDAPPCPGILGL